MTLSRSSICLLPLMAGCHLFADGTIPCSKDELPECAEGDADTDADADSDTDADTDADTDSDTDADPVVGVALLGTDGKSLNSWVRAFGPDGVSIAGWEGISVMTGPVAYDSKTGRFWTAYDNLLYSIEETGETYEYKAFEDELRDLRLVGSDLYAVTPDGLFLVVAQQYVTRLTADGSFVNLDSVFTADSTGLHLVDMGSADVAPSLYRYDISQGTLSVVYSEYDTTRARSVDGFFGPGSAPFVCSAGGGAYSVDTIFNTVPGTDGRKSVAPERLASGSPNDIVDCGYDAATDEVIFVSLSLGALRVSADNATTAWVALSEGEQVTRGEVFTP